jgi:hypothetical protein
MLHEFVTANRKALIARCKEKVAKRFQPSAIPAAVDHGVPLFLQQLVDTLRAEQLTGSRDPAGPAPTPAPTEIGRAAALHGAELLRLGYTVDQVVHDYGDVCQSVTDLAVEQKAVISTDEFRTLNRCLDNAIADAVTSYGHGRQISVDRQAQSLQERLDYFADEHKRLVEIASQAHAAMRTGSVGLTGATAALLVHALGELGSLSDRTLPGIRQAVDAKSGKPG